MPGHISAVSKGRILREADKAMKEPSDAVIQRYQDSESLVDIGVGEQLYPPEGREHAEVEWFGQVQGRSYWPDVPLKMEIVRAAYRKAIEISTNYPQNKPIVSYWVVGQPAFHAVVAETDREVHVLLLTPEPQNAGPPQPPPTPIEERMWEVGSEEFINDLVQRFQAAGYDPGPPEDTGEAGVKMLKLIGY